MCVCSRVRVIKWLFVDSRICTVDMALEGDNLNGQDTGHVVCKYVKKKKEDDTAVFEEAVELL